MAEPRILLFMDDAGVLSSLDFALSLNGFAVADGSRADPSAAAALVVDQAYRGDGAAFLAGLRVAEYAAPAVLLATNPTRALCARADAAGAVIVEKPLLGDDLTRTLERLLKNPETPMRPASRQLPEGAEPYKRTATFTEASVPAGLLNDHSTKDGTWALVHVEEGRLRYLVTDARRERFETILTPETAPGVIEPAILHRVDPLGAVRFHVEFFRLPQG